MSRPLGLATRGRWIRLTRATVPQLYVCCGTEDPSYEENLAFRDACHAAGVPLTANFGAGEHVWDYWDAKIQQVLSWLPLTGC